MPRDAERPLSGQRKIEVTDGLRKWHIVSGLNARASSLPRRTVLHVTSLPQIRAIIEEETRLKELLTHGETQALRQMDEIAASINLLIETREGLSGSDRGRLTRRINVLTQQKEGIGARLGFREEPLSMLSKVGGYRKFTVKDDSIIGQTHLIVMHGWVLGRYEIAVRVRDDRPRVQSLTRLGHAGDYYWHPHIIAPDVICWGSFSHMRQRMEGNGDIPSLFALLIQYLGSWASYDCYCQLPHMEAYQGPA